MPVSPWASILRRAPALAASAMTSAGTDFFLFSSTHGTVSKRLKVTSLILFPFTSLLRQPSEDAQRVVVQQIGTHFVGEVELGDLRQRAAMAHGRKVGAEDDFALARTAQERVHGRIPVLGRIGTGAEVDVRELERHRHRLDYPRPARVREQEVDLAEIDRRPIDAD